MTFQFFTNDIVTQARADMQKAGYTELKTASEVDVAFAKKGTTLVMINSVCGCAGGLARPAAAYALDYDKRPNQFVTVFAGQDKEATAQARSYFPEFQPSSPSFALLKDGKICDMVGRHDIEASELVTIVEKLQGLFDEHCEEV